MKKISLYTLALFLGVITIFSCSEKDRAFPEFGDDDVLTGAYPRLVEGVFGDLDYEHPNDPDSSSLSFVVEFYDANQGRDVASYSWVASYGSFGPSTIATYNSSEFTTNADGLPQLSATITFDAIFTALGMTIDDFELTEDFLLDATLTMNDGRTFTFANSGSNVVGQPTFAGLFRHVPAVTKKPCKSLLADYDDTDGAFALTGTFSAKSKVTMATLVGTPATWAGCDGSEWTGEIRIEAEHTPDSFEPGVYKIYSTNPDFGVELPEDPAFGAYYACAAYGVDATGSGLPNGGVRLTESCGVLGYSGQSQWDELYSIVGVTVDGADLTLLWENSYGEAGEVTLTRNDGQAWQTDLTCATC